jgi:N-acetylglucosaminyldiphosphoundecaprenol N-acetyl-beta-D-mannosaminyltransferase
MSANGRISLMGMPVDAMSEPEALGAIVGAIEAGRGGAVVTPHLEILRRYRDDPSVRPYVNNADVILADGQPLVWASRIMGAPLPERVAGSELIWSLAAECALRGRTVYLLGGAPGAGEAARQRLQEVYPGLRIVGCESPPMGFDSDPEAMAAIADRLRAARPDVVFVALGFPKQERVIAELRDVLPSAWFLGVGVSLSFVAGHVARAPDWAMRYGLEWLHRLMQEPRRLARRYLLDGLPFALRLFAHALRRRVVGRGGSPPVPAAAFAGAAPTRVVFHHGSLERARMRDLAEFAAAYDADGPSA